VDPAKKTLEVMKLVEGRRVVWQAFEDETLIRSEPFEIVELEMVRWFWGVGLEAPVEPASEPDAP